MTALSLALTGCNFGSAINSQSVNQGPDSGGNNGGQGGGVIETPEELDVIGKINDGAYAGLEVLRIDPVAQEMIMSIPMPIPFGKPVRKELNGNDLNGGYWELKQYEMNKWVVEIHIPLGHLVQGKFSEVPSAKLPNGQNLPGIASGELPGFAVKWQDDDEEKEIFIYLGGGTAAVFVPTYNFDPFFAINIPIKDKEQKRVGWFSTVPETDAYYGGIYMAILLPKNTAKWIDENLF